MLTTAEISLLRLTERDACRVGRSADVHARDALRLSGAVERVHLDGSCVRAENVEVAAGRRISSSDSCTTGAKGLLLAPDSCRLTVNGRGTRRESVRLLEEDQRQKPLK